MRNLTLASLWGRKRRLAGIAVAIVLGVSFLSGTMVLGDTLSANFDRLFTEVSAGTDVVVRNPLTIDGEGPNEQTGLIDASLVETVEQVDGVAVAEAQVVGYGQLLGRDGSPVGGMGPPRLAGSWINDPDLNPYQLVEGRAPETTDEVVINRGAAIDGNLEVGDTTTVQTPTPVEVTVVGVATFGDSDGLGETTWTAFTLEGAQEHVTRQPDQVSTISAKAESGTSADELSERVRQAVPADTEVITGSDLAAERTDEIQGDFLAGMRMFLVMFAGIALVVAALTIHNSFSVTVAQRTHELALLRTVGASRRQVRRMVRTEALVLGLVASGGGAALGLGVAGLLKGLFDSFGFALPAGGLEIRPMSLAIAIVAGLVATLVAAQSAVRRASRVAPIAALRATGVEARVLGRARLLSGAVTAALGVGLSVVGISSQSLLTSGAGALMLLGTTLLLSPVLLPPTAKALGGILRATRGTTGRLAEENARRNPRRSAATATALMVGVAVVTLFTIMGANIKASFEQTISEDVTADLTISMTGFGEAGMDPQLANEVGDLPEVDNSVGLGGGSVVVNEDDTPVTGADIEELATVTDLTPVDGSLTSGGTDSVAVSESKADSEGWSAGDTFEISFIDGATVPVTVSGVFEDNGMIGSIVMDPELLDEHTQQPTDSAVLLNLADGVDEAQARQVLEPLTDAYGGEVQNREELGGSVAEALDMMLSVIYALLALAIIIALLGIANTLSLATYERRQEIGMLRAVGQTRRQTRSTLRLESMLLAVYGTSIGLVLGSVLAFTLYLTGEEGASFVYPTSRLAVVVVLGALAGVLAAIRPARRAARLPILNAITTE